MWKLQPWAQCRMAHPRVAFDRGRVPLSPIVTPSCPSRPCVPVVVEQAAHWRFDPVHCHLVLSDFTASCFTRRWTGPGAPDVSSQQALSLWKPVSMAEQGAQWVMWEVRSG